MKIGELVKRNIPAVLQYCENKPGELEKLQDAAFSKSTFDINYPFCKPAATIDGQLNDRYYAKEYVVGGTVVRVTNDWYNKSFSLVERYLRVRGLIEQGETGSLGVAAAAPHPSPATKPSRGRYKGNAIGNAQNYLVRNILSRLGEETFGQSQWESVVASFDHSCAYCGSKVDIAMDHVIPTNKQSLGEHRLGNLVPACRSCNVRKADRSLSEFLAHDPARLEAIRRHAEKHSYTPIIDQQRLRQILEMAHEEVRQMADRYVALINAVILSDTSQTSKQQTPDA